MPSNFQSIEDLMDDEGAGSERTQETSAPAKFKEKQAAIKAKEIEKQVSEAARAAGVPYINLAGFPVSPEALAKIPQAQSEQLRAVCFFYDGEQFRVGAVDITDEVEKILEQLRGSLHCRGELYLISQASFAAVYKLYQNLPKIKEVIRGVKVTDEELAKYTESFSSFKDLQAAVVSADVTQVIVMVLAAAVKARASDIHIEGEQSDIKVRFRVDGILHDAADFDKKIWDKVI